MDQAARPNISFSNKNRLYLIPAVILLLALVVMLFKMMSGGQSMQMPPAMVGLVKVREQQIKKPETFIGLVEAEREVEIKPRVKGFLINRPFVEGEMVTEGQLLFQIEPFQYQADLNSAKAAVLSAQANLIRAEADYLRIKGLYDKSSTTKADYDERKAAYDSAKAQLLQAQAQVQQAELNLNYTDIKAPFNGQISDSKFHLGSLIDPNTGQVLTTVVSLNPILVTFGVSEQIAKTYKNIDLNQGQAVVKIRLNDDDPEQVKEGRLIFIDSRVNRQTDTIKFKASLENADHALTPGQIVTVDLIIVSDKKSLLVPQRAVMTGSDGQRYVMVVDGEGQSAINPVTVAGEYESDYIISSGLSAGQEIIQDGLVYMGSPLPPGMPVQIIANQGKPNSPQADLEPEKGQGD